MIPISQVAKVSVNVSPSAPAAANFGQGILIGQTAILPPEERVVEITEPDDLVALGYPTTSPEYLAASVYFQQKNAPKLLVGQIFPSGSPGLLRGAAADQAIGDYTAKGANCGFDITVDGTLHQVTGIDLHLAASLAAVATAVNGAVSAFATCTYNAATKGFTIASLTTGATSAVSFAAAPTHSGSPADISALLGLTSAAGASEVAVIQPETTATASFDALALAAQQLGFPFFGLALCTDVAALSDGSQTYLYTAQDWAEANGKLCFFVVTGSVPTTYNAAAGTQPNAGARARALGYNNSVGIYSGQSNLAHVALMGQAFQIDFTQKDGLKTMMYMPLTGMAADPLTVTTAAQVASNGLNYFAQYGVSNIVAPGVVVNGRWYDEVVGCAWMQNAETVALFTALLNTAAQGKMPQTDEGVNMLLPTIKQPLDAAVNVGLCAPGVWDSGGVGTVKQDDYLPKGYYVYAAPVTSLTAAQRTARQTPALVVLMVGAGALQGVNLTINFQR